MAAALDMEKIAKDLGAERRGRIKASGGYFGALHIAAEAKSRFRTPPGGGRATDPAWTEQRLVRLSPTTLERLEELAEEVEVSPMQIAAILLERAANQALQRTAKRRR